MHFQLLPSAVLRRDPGQVVAPRTQTEQIVADLFVEVLKLRAAPLSLRSLTESGPPQQKIRPRLSFFCF